MLVINDPTVRIAGRNLLEGASARIPAGARIGLVGRNGTGKTTLFGVIAGDISAEQGHVEIPPRWRIGRWSASRIPAVKVTGTSPVAKLGGFCV